MTPEGQRYLRRAVLFDFHMDWLHQEIVATVDAGRSDLALRFDLAHLMRTHQQDFDAGWRHHPILPNRLLYLIASRHGIPRWIEGWWSWEARRN